MKSLIFITILAIFLPNAVYAGYSYTYADSYVPTQIKQLPKHLAYAPQYQDEIGSKSGKIYKEKAVTGNLYDETMRFLGIQLTNCIVLGYGGNFWFTNKFSFENQIIFFLH